MHYVTNYSFKPHLTKQETEALMTTFGAVGTAPGTTAHFVRVDGQGGTVVGETDDVAGLYRNTLTYSEWMEFDVNLVLPVDDAVPQVYDYLA